MRGLGVLFGSVIIMWIINIGSYKSEANYYFGGTSSVPLAIKIQKISVVQDVVPGVIQGQDWQIDESRVNYLIGSGNLYGGNMVLYAHRREGLFQKLNLLKDGDEIVILFESDIKIYEVIESEMISSSEVEILTDDSYDLTVFTCDGWFDSKRWVVKAREIKV